MTNISKNSQKSSFLQENSLPSPRSGTPPKEAAKALLASPGGVPSYVPGGKIDVDFLIPEKRVPSNSPLEQSFLLYLCVKKLGIDKVSIVFPFSCLNGYGSCTKYGRLKFKNFLDKYSDEIICDRGSSDNYKHHYSLKGGVDLQFFPFRGIRKKVEDIEFITRYGDDEDKENGFIWVHEKPNATVRLEFHPIKSDLSQCGKICSFLGEFLKADGKGIEDIRFTRLDFCIDYDYFFDLAGICPGNGFMRKCILGHNSIETFYYGSPRSNYQFRIYNKKQEIEKKLKEEIKYEFLNRIELQCNDSFYLNKDAIDKFLGRCLDLFCDLNCWVFQSNKDDWKFKHFIAYARAFGVYHSLQELPARTGGDVRFKMKEKFKKSKWPENLHPAKVFSRDCVGVVDCLIDNIMEHFRLEKGGV